MAPLAFSSLFSSCSALEHEQHDDLKPHFAVTVVDRLHKRRHLSNLERTFAFRARRIPEAFVDARYHVLAEGGETVGSSTTTVS